jgi:hypothetical protein
MRKLNWILAIGIGSAALSTQASLNFGLILTDQGYAGDGILGNTDLHLTSVADASDSFSGSAHGMSSALQVNIKNGTLHAYSAISRVAGGYLFPSSSLLK